MGRRRNSAPRRQGLPSRNSFVPQALFKVLGPMEYSQNLNLVRQQVVENQILFKGLPTRKTRADFRSGCPSRHGHPILGLVDMSANVSYATAKKRSPMSRSARSTRSSAIPSDTLVSLWLDYIAGSHRTFALWE